MNRSFTRLKEICSFLAVLLCLVASAQKTPSFEIFSTSKGLSQGMVFDILQDKEGFIWVATKNGLNRFDGYSFSVFTNDPYAPNSLSSNTLSVLFEDKKGRLWVGTENGGLNIYNKKTGKFHRIGHQPGDTAGLSGNRIRPFITETTDGKILVAIENAGFNIIQITDDYFERATPPKITQLSLPANTQVYGMGKDSAGRIWIGGMDGTVYHFTPGKNSFAKLDGGQLLNNGYFTRDSSILISNNLFLYHGGETYPLFDTDKIKPGNIVFKPRQALWENHHRELYFYDVSYYSAGKQVVWNAQLPAETRLNYPFIIDRSGILWSGSVGYGLRKYTIAVNRFKAQLARNSVKWIVPLSARDLFIADFGYGWLRLRDGTREESLNHIFAGNQVDNFLVSQQGDYWLKTDAKGYARYKVRSGEWIIFPGTKDENSIGTKQPMLEDREGHIWFSGLGGRFTLINSASNRVDSLNIGGNTARPLAPKAICTALYQDGQGVFWIGTQEGFVRVLMENGKPANAQLTWYYNSSTTRNSLNYNHVSCFLDDPREPQKYLWIATKGGGLNRLNKTTGDFLHYTEKDGLPNDVVYGILADNAGNIWGSTNRGIFCLITSAGADSKQWSVRKFTKADGLQDDEFNTGSFAKLPDGSLAFGGINGLNVFNPEEVLKAGFSPNIFITNILVGNQPVLPNDKTGVLQQTIEQSQSITLNHLQDILTLEFSSLDFTAPHQNKYRYQLVGIDNNWVESGTRRNATYLHLPAGKYVFKVQGSNSQGEWSSHIAELGITVFPPWWSSWWAYVLYALIVALAIREYFRFTVNRAKLKTQLNFEQLEARRIKELDVVKTQLYTNITHEFRTPLTVIIGMAQQVKANPAAHLENGLEMIVRNGQSLLNLVNEMLDLSKLETGKMQLQLEKGDVINFLRYIVESFHSLAESQQKQLHLLAELDELYIRYDREKLRQILSNLLSNALKFTPEKGNIYVTVNCIPELPKDQSCKLIIKVKDTGIGIPENQIAHIFDRFYQLDNSLNRKTEGTGIGLALTRELVKLMNGEITVKSPPTGSNRGTEFSVILPFKKLAASEEPSVQQSPQPTIKTTADSQIVQVNPVMEKQPQKALILLVEDNADVVAYTASCLPDYRLAVGKDGAEGLEIAKDLIPDLIITDVMMPFMDGFELCRQLRKCGHTSHIPIIMLTAKADMSSRIEGLQQGADAYLEKPFNREELLVRIQKLLELRQSLQDYYLKKAGLTFSTNPAEKMPAIPNVLPEKETEDAFVKKVRETIEANLSDAEFSIEQLCKQLYMSHSQLHRKLDALTGCAPNKFIRLIRLNKACELLMSSTESISSIALDCGYNDAGYFARVFKQEFGISPQEWRLQK